MNQVLGITIDGTFYHVGIEYESMQRSFELTEGPNNGTAITGRAIRDILGTTYSYSMTVYVDPAYPNDYDALYEVITEPVDYHTISLIYGQETITFDAQIKSGSDKYKGFFANHNYWDEMSLTFIPMEPQRTTSVWSPSGSSS